MRTKSIAILGARGIPARYGGFETFAEELSVRLVDKGVPVTVFCEKDDTDQPKTYKGVRLRYVGALAAGPLTTIMFDLACLIKASKGFDVVYMLYPFMPCIYGANRPAYY